jgi:hypothetical protein
MNRLFNLLPMKTWLILAVVVMCLLALLSWRGACQEVDRARDQGTIADARAGSAEKAVDAVAKNAAANEATRDQVEEAQDAIRSESDPVRRDAIARRELCKLQRPDGPC